MGKGKQKATREPVELGLSRSTRRAAERYYSAALLYSIYDIPNNTKLRRIVRHFRKGCAPAPASNKWSAATLPIDNHPKNPYDFFPNTRKRGLTRAPHLQRTGESVMSTRTTIFGTLLLFGALCVFSGAARAADASKLFLPGDVTLEQAQKVITAAVQKAEQQGTLMDIAVVDAGGNLKAFVRMDGAYLGSIEISIQKAKSARALNMSTTELGAAAQPGKPLYGIEVTNGGMIIFGGGELLKNKNGLIIGAVGVSGDSVENDVEVAKAGAAALLR